MYRKARPLKDPTDAEHAYNYALFVLNISMRTQAEMKEKMEKRGYVSSVITEVIERLHTDRYIDDERYAEVYIRSMKNYKTWGRYMMKQKMLLKKLPEKLIEQSLAAQFSLEEEQAIAKRYVEKTFGDLDQVKSFQYQEKQKIKQRLASRGFGFDAMDFF